MPFRKTINVINFEYTHMRYTSTWYVSRCLNVYKCTFVLLSRVVKVTKTQGNEDYVNNSGKLNEEKQQQTQIIKQKLRK